MPDSFQKSLMQAHWVMPDVDLDTVERIARRHNLPEIVARLLCARGVADEAIESFLNPTLRRDFPDPLTMAGMEAAAAHLAQAVIDKKQIAIFGDFDVDGATSSALLYRFLKLCGCEARIYIPERLTEGYGPNADALQSLRNEGAQVLVLLDCGTTAFETIGAGRDMGLEIIIADHHEAEENLPPAHHIINPKRKDDTSGLTMLAAVGVTFMLCVAVNAKLREAGHYKDRAEPKLTSFLDLVALGTVCDMVPLTGVNRLLVRQGFAQMNETQNPGLRALIEVSRINSRIDPYHAGFILGPRINAGSRVHKSDLGARLLATDDAEEANQIAWTLNDCNDKRKALQAEMEAQAINKAEDLALDRHPAIIVADETWHAGLTGLVAGRLKERFSRPACVATYYENEHGQVEMRGSGRSVPGIHIAQAFIDAREAGIIEKGGGHAMAGGFTLNPEKFQEFQEFLYAHIARQMENSGGNVETVLDGMLTVRGVRVDLVRLIEDHIGPFGQEHPEPLFVLRNVRIQMADVVGDSHIRLQVSDWEGGSRIKAMAFRAVGTPMGEALLKQGRRGFDLAGNLKINSWQGRESAEMHVKDAAFSLAGEEQEGARLAR